MLDVKFSEKWLKKESACALGLTFWKKYKDQDPKKAISRAIVMGEYAFAVWGICKTSGRDKMEFMREYFAIAGKDITNVGAKKYLIAKGYL